MWNVNGLGEMGEYVHELVNTSESDVILRTENKRRRTIDVSIDLALDPQTYRAIQLNSTVHHLGGMIMVLKTALRVETAELVRVSIGDEFIQELVIEDNERNAMVGWYCAPTVTAEVLGDN